MKRILITVLTTFVFSLLINASSVKILFAQQRTVEPTPPLGPKSIPPQLILDGTKQRKPEGTPPFGPTVQVPQLSSGPKDTAKKLKELELSHNSLIRLLIEKGVITQKELSDKMDLVDREMEKKETKEKSK